MQDVTHCKYYVTRKKRYCRMTVKQDREYCGEHEPSAEALNDRLRVVCPLDRKHTCYAHKLTKHLKICNARQDNTLPYIVKGINSNARDPEIKRSLTSVPIEELNVLISRVNEIYTDLIANNIKEQILKHMIIEDEIVKPEYGDRTRKHMIQVSSILGHLQENNLLANDTCYIEFGAGKGQLSYWVSKSIEELDKSSVLLVERASLRHKHDNKLDKTAGRVNRIRADIADLVLNKIECLNDTKKVVAVTKHLCGDATDLAMRCLANYKETGGDVLGLVMAFCCHHRCRWDVYTGQEFFESVYLSKVDFDVMCGLVSWATSGTGFSRQRKDQNGFIKRDIQIRYTREEREEIGRRCKNLIDWGRLSYLEKIGLDCSLFYYVPLTVSLENVCVVGSKS